MKVVIAPDKFKGSLSAKLLCQAIEKGIHNYDKNIEVLLNPLADGGDGSLEVLQQYIDFETIHVEVADPLLRPIRATYKMKETTAYIEMSAASGLVLLKEEMRNCMETSTLGTGELILDAIQRGAKSIFLFIGGSATNDGGIGVAQAMGYRFLDSSGKELSPIGKNLTKIYSIDDTQLKVNLEEVDVKVVCDVNNPFYGKQGAAYVYAAQKGANAEDIAYLDEGLQNLATVLADEQNIHIANIAGAGAAGGLGGGAIAFLNAKMISGIQAFINWTQLDQKLKNIDLIITGEGKLDEQTEQGKVISGVAHLAKKYKIPLLVICGTATNKNTKSLGIDRIYTVLDISDSVEEAMRLAAVKVEELAFRAIRDFLKTV